METEQVDNRLIYCLNEALDEAAKAAYKRLKAIAEFADNVKAPFAMYGAVCDIDVVESRYFYSLSSKMRYYCDDINGGNYTLRFTREGGDIVVFYFNRYDNTTHSVDGQTYELSLNDTLQILGAMEVCLSQSERDNKQKSVKNRDLSVNAKIDCLIGAPIGEDIEVGMPEFDANKLYLYLSANAACLRLKAVGKLAKENGISTSSYFTEFKVVFKDDNDTPLLEARLKDQGRTLIIPYNVRSNSGEAPTSFDLTYVGASILAHLPVRVIKKILKATRVEIVHDSPELFADTDRVIAQAKL